MPIEAGMSVGVGKRRKGHCHPHQPSLENLSKLSHQLHYNIHGENTVIIFNENKGSRLMHTLPNSSKIEAFPCIQRKIQACGASHRWCHKNKGCEG